MKGAVRWEGSSNEAKIILQGLKASYDTVSRVNNIGAIDTVINE